MADLNNVSEGLKCHHINDLNRINCAGCPYYKKNDTAMRCLNKLHDDALELLKKQNKLIEQYDKWAYGKITLCRDCKFLNGCKIFNAHGKDTNWFCADGECK